MSEYEDADMGDICDNCGEPMINCECEEDSTENTSGLATGGYVAPLDPPYVVGERPSEQTIPVKASAPTRNCIHDGFPCDASDLCEECPLKSSETLGEELARKSAETFEAEKATGKVGMHPQCREPNNCQADQNGYCAGCHAATYP